MKDLTPIGDEQFYLRRKEEAIRNRIYRVAAEAENAPEYQALISEVNAYLAPWLETLTPQQRATFNEIEALRIECEGIRLFAVYTAFRASFNSKITRGRREARP